jgi:hypothetical protein
VKCFSAHLLAAGERRHETPHRERWETNALALAGADGARGCGGMIGLCMGILIGFDYRVAGLIALAVVALFALCVPRGGRA